MHGRPRVPQNPEDEGVLAAKAQKLRSLQSQLLSNHHSKIYTKEALEVSAKLLEINPESYTAWNFRKLAVQHSLTRSESDDPDSVKAILNDELRVVENALKQNFKSYGAWYHRKWVLSKGHSSMEHELRLLDRLQKADSRNFHAWNYRRFVAELMKRSEDDELNYTTDMINNNFSNYSAWHNRSILLSNMLNKKVQGFTPKEKVLSEEFELVHQALFTDPDDQSGWFYHLWLLDQTIKHDSPRLVSSWPAHAHNVTSYLDNHALSPFDCSSSESGTFPLVLYFDQAVEGVNSSTVTVESVITTNKDLIWKPLSQSNSKIAQVWATHLIFAGGELHSSEAYPVKVSLGHAQGIISSSGYPYIHKTCFTFKVCRQPIETKPAGLQDGGGIVWNDDRFFIYSPHLQDSSPSICFDQLSIEVDHELSSTSKWRAQTISNEIALFRELLLEINCKIGKLTLTRLLTAHDAILSPHANNVSHSEEVLKLYEDLMKLEPSHLHYYKEEHSLVLLRQLTSTWESILKHCYQYGESCSSSNLCNSICLRLNNLSISRIGSIEKLLWVQMLDLSHNELKSIEGLQAMQLLSCLNLSYNKFSSFAALDPLRPLKSLKVLNISYNEIGSHSIDTARYLCSSPLSHSEVIDSNFKKLVCDGVNVTKYWEAYLVFKDLSLTQLDLVGNVISDEEFVSFLTKVAPTLKLLDGVELH